MSPLKGVRIAEFFVQDMTRRHVFDPATRAPREFVSSYHSLLPPNPWDRSGEF